LPGLVAATLGNDAEGKGGGEAGHVAGGFVGSAAEGAVVGQTGAQQAAWCSATESTKVISRSTTSAGGGERRDCRPVKARQRPQPLSGLPRSRFHDDVMSTDRLAGGAGDEVVATLAWLRAAAASTAGVGTAGSSQGGRHHRPQFPWRRQYGGGVGWE